VKYDYYADNFLVSYRETCIVTFLLGGINCVRSTRSLPSGEVSRVQISFLKGDQEGFCTFGCAEYPACDAFLTNLVRRLIYLNFISGQKPAPDPDLIQQRPDFEYTVPVLRIQKFFFKIVRKLLPVL
jgi:hypothetical protein